MRNEDMDHFRSKRNAGNPRSKKHDSLPQQGRARPYIRSVREKNPEKNPRGRPEKAEKRPGWKEKTVYNNEHAKRRDPAALITRTKSGGRPEAARKHHERRLHVRNSFLKRLALVLHRTRRRRASRDRLHGRHRAEGCRMRRGRARRRAGNA